MARKKKIFNYEFIDCEKSFNSSVEVVCTQTKEKVKMYHRQLVKLIENKYRNNYSLFKATYIKKGNKPENNNVNEFGEYNPAPEGYRKYLVTAYMALMKDVALDKSNKAVKMSFINDCYIKRYSSSIEGAIKFAEQA
jgi:hypothetical protein